LEEAGLINFIDRGSIRSAREGITFTITDRAGFLAAINSNPAFAHNTPFGAAHARLTRSLQVNVGKERTDSFGNKVTKGYADLDCDNPAQDVRSFIRHTTHVILNWFR
jgi:hypothetical protein